MKLKTFTENHTSISQLCRRWEEANRLPYARFGNRMGAIIMLLMVPANYVVIAPEHVKPYAQLQGLVIAICLLNLGLVAGIERFSVERRNRIAAWCNASPLLALFGIYLAMIFLPYDQYMPSVFLSLLGISFFGGLFLHRFWREQYLFSTLCTFSLGIVTLLKPRYYTELGTIAVWQLVVAVAMFVFRRDFFAALAARFLALQMFLPPKVAAAVSAAGQDEDFAAAFAPTNRFIVCLCSDWRDFQKLATEVDAPRLCAILETYYDIVLKHLQAIAVDGRYYVDWTADELFVVFYTEKDGIEQCVDQAARFARVLATEVADEAVRVCHPTLRFDIGMACGFGLAGVMGPERMKKTTVASNVVGIAKRLEGEAKAYRKATDPLRRPVLMVEESLVAPLQSFAFAGERFDPLIATSKNVEGQTCYHWVDASA